MGRPPARTEIPGHRPHSSPGRLGRCRTGRAPGGSAVGGRRTAPRGAAGQHPRISPLVERGGPGRGRRGRHQPHPARRRTGPRHPAHRLPGPGHPTRPPAAAGRPGPPGCADAGHRHRRVRRTPRPVRRSRAGRHAVDGRRPRNPDAALLHLRIDRRAQGRDLHPGAAGGGRKVARRPLRRPARGRPLHLHADVPRQRGDRRLGARTGKRGRRRAPPPLLGLRIPRRRTGARGDVLHLCRPRRAVPAGHPRAPGRRRAPAAARLRHRGRCGGRGPVPGAVRGAAGRGLRLLRGRCGDPADREHPGAGDREGVGPRRSRGRGPGNRRGTGHRRLRRGRPS